MKFSQVLKSVAVAAAVAASASSFAAVVDSASDTEYSLVNGTGKLTFSSDANGTLGLVGITVGAAGTTVQSGNDLTQPTTGYTRDGLAIKTLSFQGASVTLTKGSTVISLNDFVFNVDQKVLYGNLKVGSSTSNIGIFNVATLNGSTNIPAGLLPGQSATVTNNLSGLKLTDSAVNLLGDGLGVPALFRPALAQVDFGTLSANTTIAAAVPEPSTYALMGIGLAGVAFAARRRKAA